MDPFRSSCYCEYGRNDDVSVASSEKKSTTEACKSHKEAERRRRQRINAHLSTLRSLLPDTTKVSTQSFFITCHFSLVTMALR